MFVNWSDTYGWAWCIGEFYLFRRLLVGRVIISKLISFDFTNLLAGSLVLVGGSEDSRCFFFGNCSGC